MTGKLAQIIALKVGYGSLEAEFIGWAAVLHDIGKCAVSQEILNKEGKLTPDELETVKYHTLYGWQILTHLHNSFGELSADIALYHHEHFDGSGYWGKFSNELPAYIPIVTICDVYSALVTARAYKTAWTHKKAMDYIKSKSNQQFSPVLVDLFFSVFEQGIGLESVPALNNYGVVEFDKKTMLDIKF